MNPLSTSNSDDGRTFPVITKAAVVAIAVLVGARVALLALPDDVLTEGYSIRARNFMESELEYRQRGDYHPRVLLLGTSRVLPISTERLATLLEVEPADVFKLARPGADFFFIEAQLRRNPGLLSSLEVLMFDLSAFQTMETTNFDESGAFFLRHSTFDQRLNARQWPDRVVGVTDTLLPAWSHSQGPFQWRRGVHYLAMTPGERLKWLRQQPVTNFGDWATVVDLLEAARAEDRLREQMAGMFYPEAVVVTNQVAALRNIFAMAPEDCRVILVWLPVRPDMKAFVEETPVRLESRETFRSIIDSIEDPRVEVRWFAEASDLGLSADDFSDDGIHLERSGRARVVEELAALARPHLRDTARLSMD